MPGLLDYFAQRQGPQVQFPDSMAKKHLKQRIGLLMGGENEAIPNMAESVANARALLKPQIAQDIFGPGQPDPEAAKAYEDKMKNIALAAMTVYHGSPYKFDKFDMSKIGTGEGAQAYGHGLYMAESPDVAMTYQPRDKKMEQLLMRKYSAAEKAQSYPSMQVYEDFLLHKTPQEVADNIASYGYTGQELKQAQRALADATKQYHSQKAGVLYKVDIPDEAIPRMLDWDKPLSEQATSVQDAIKSAATKYRNGATRKGKTALESLIEQDAHGGQLYESLATQIYGIGNRADAPASQGLLSLNVPGIRYLDGMSRNAGQGSYNYVLFDDQLPRILEINGVPTGNQPWLPGEFQGLLGR